MKKSFVLCVVMSLFLAACNTVEGMGQDLQSAGHSISKAAK